MPKIDKNQYEAAEAMGGGEYKRMEAGGYVCTIQAVRTRGTDYNGNEVDYVSDKSYVKLIWDVAEGEFAGKFSDDYWAGEDKDYAHQFYLSWKNLGALKNAIQCLDESNPGFDSMAAFESDKWALFIGKQFGIVLGEEEYLANDGSVKTRFGFGRIKSVQDIRDGKFKVPPLKKLDGAEEEQPAKAETYDDVPF